MDGEPDLIMEEVPLMGTTQLSGEDATVDPSVFAMDHELHSPLSRKEQLPILSYPELTPFSPSPALFDSHSIPHETAAQEAPSSATGQSAMSTPDVMRDATPPYRSFVGVVIPRKPKLGALPYATQQSGLVHDVRMRFHMELPSIMESDDLHPEDPRRILEIYRELDEAGLIMDGRKPDPEDEFKLFRIPIREATMEEICLVHTVQHFHWVKSLQYMSDTDLGILAAKHDSVYLHNSTFYCALLSAGGAIEACRSVVTGVVKNAIAVIRPPGHHAEPDSAGGFCFFNNVPVAVKVCQRDFPEVCRKVLILDWDVHHGNGVQRAFEDDPNVLYISLHVYMNGAFYPQGTYGDHFHCGVGPGLGFNVNIPWSEQGMRDGDYIYAFQHVVMPIAREFNPDLVVVSAGFDAADGDMLGGCHVTPAGYTHMTHMLMSLAKGKVVVCLEGGYNLRAIAKSAVAVTRTLMGEPPDRLDDVKQQASSSGVQTVHKVIREQSKHWSNLYPKKDITKITPVVEKDRVHDIFRSWQEKQLREKHNMFPLYILRDKLSKSFQDQVLATPDYAEARPLLIIIHDPPEVEALGHSETGKVELHNITLADSARSYINLAVENDFGVIDINIPKYITEENDDGQYKETEGSERRAAAARELLNYLWENYIEINDSTDIFFMAVGVPHHGLADFLSNQEPEDRRRIQGVISFVEEGYLKSVRSYTDDNLSAWYYQHSRVFVAHRDIMRENDRRKKGKKYGDIVRSPYKDLQSMLHMHRESVLDLLVSRTEDWRVRHRRLRADEEARQQSKEATKGPQLNNNRSTPASMGLSLEEPAGWSRPPSAGGSGTTTGAFRSPMHSPTKGTVPPMGFFGGSPQRSPTKK